MAWRTCLCAAVVLMFAGAGYAQDAVVEFEGRYWMPAMDADIKVVDSGIGTEFSAQDDLGIEDENFPDGRVTWNTGPNSRLRLGYTQINYSGSKEVTRTIQFAGQTYSAGALVNSEMDVDYLRLGWIWQFINLLDDKVKLGPIVEAKGIMADVSLVAPNLSPAINESQDFTGGLPTLGLALDIVPAKQISLFAELSGLYGGSYGYFFDAETGVEFRPFKYVSIVAGYRMIDFKVEYDEDSAKMRIAGPFVGGKIRF